MREALESRAAMQAVVEAAVDDGRQVLASTSGAPAARLAVLFDQVPALVGYYSEGTAALAADFYEDERARAGVRSRFTARLVVADRSVKLRRAIAWAADPLEVGDELTSGSRLAEVIQLDTARPYRDTILGNRRLDPDAAGWRRIANPGACGFCRMLAGRGAVYKRSTVQFASHENCFCSAQPVWSTDDSLEASAFQYMASLRQRTPKQQAALREYLKVNFPD